MIPEKNQFQYISKKPFSNEQKSYACIPVMGYFVLLILLPMLLFWSSQNKGLVLKTVFLPYGIAIIPILLLCTVCLKLVSLAWYRVSLSDKGVAIITSRGKVKRLLPWDEIKIYTVSTIADKTNYICLSTDEKLPTRDAFYPGMIWVMFTNKHTISVEVDITFLGILNNRLGHLRKTVNRYRATTEEVKQVFKKSYIFTGIVTLLVVLTCFLCFLFA